jgi:WD40 repeat protein
MWSFGHITRWDATTWETISTLRADHGQLVFDMAYAPDGAFIATALAAGYVRLWSAEGALLNTLRAHGESVRCLAFAPDGGWLATGSSDRTIRLWDTGTWEQAAAFQRHTDAVQDVGWSPDGAWLASAGGDGLRLWDVTSRQEADTAGDAGALRCVQFDASGGRLFAAGEGGAVGVWGL